MIQDFNLANAHTPRRPQGLATEMSQSLRHALTRAVMIELTNSAAGVLLPVHAQPNARQDGIVGIHDGRLKVAVTQAPEKGKANKQFIRVIATALGLKRSQIELVKGQTSSTKTFAVSGISQAELQSRIATILKD